MYVELRKEVKFDLIFEIMTLMISDYICMLPKMEGKEAPKEKRLESIELPPNGSI